MKENTAEVYICPVCNRDFGDEKVNYDHCHVLQKKICEFCQLEICLEFYEEEGGHYLDMAIDASGFDQWEYKKRYLEGIVAKIKALLTVNDLSDEERVHKQWNLQQCENQVNTISAYQQALLNCEDKETQNAANSELQNAMKVRAFGIDLVRGNVNHLTG